MKNLEKKVKWLNHSDAVNFTKISNLQLQGPERRSRILCWRLEIKTFFVFSLQVSQDASSVIVTSSSIFDCCLFVINHFISVDWTKNNWFQTGSHTGSSVKIVVGRTADEISWTVVSVRIVCWMVCSQTPDQCSQLNTHVSNLKLVLVVLLVTCLWC